MEAVVIAAPPTAMFRRPVTPTCNVAFFSMSSKKLNRPVSTGRCSARDIAMKQISIAEELKKGDAREARS